MYIGEIGKGITPRFYRGGTDVELHPKVEGGVYTIGWSEIFDTEVDVRYALDGFCYIGGVEVDLSGAAALGIFLDGSRIACHGVSGFFPVDQSGQELTLKIRGDLCDVRLSGVEILGFYPEDEEPLLFPVPKKMRVGGGGFPLGDIVGEGVDGIYAADFLRKSLAERFGFEEGEGGTVRFEIAPEYEKERYTVGTDGHIITVRAGSRLALLWGACRIIDLYDDGVLPEVEIDDMPDTKMRGFHMGLPRADRLDFAKRLFRYVLLPLGYNHVIIEFNGGMRFERHPEISEKWLEAEAGYRAGRQPRIQHAEMGADGTLLEKEEVRGLIDVLHEYGIEVIPEVQSFGHVQYLTNAHPEIAEVAVEPREEVDERAQDVLPDEYYAHSYCPSREDSMRYIFDIIDEIVEVARPTRYVHIGHDEIYQVGSCPVCAARGKGRVYVDHILALRSHVKAKGLDIMIWSDMLHKGVLPYSDDTAGMKGELPRDIVMLDFTWYFSLDREIEDELLDAGFSVMMGNLYSSHYPRYKKRMAKRGMIGGEVSTWIAVNERDYAEYGKFFDLAYTSEMLWNADGYDERQRTAYTTLIGQCILPEMRDLIRGRYDLYLVSGPEEGEIVGLFPGDESRVPEELSFLSLVEPTEPLDVGERYDRLVFEHATVNPEARVAWKPLRRVGTYTVEYADGTSEEVPVDYAGGILHWNSIYGEPKPQAYYRHMGYVGTWIADPTFESRTAEGQPILLLGQPWDNPHPEKVIAGIRYTPDPADTAILISGGVHGYRL